MFQIQYHPTTITTTQRQSFGYVLAVWVVNQDGKLPLML